MLKLNFQLEWGELSNKISNDYSLLKDYLLSERCHCICSLLFCSHGYNCLLFFAFRCVLSFCMGTIYIYSKARMLPGLLVPLAIGLSFE